MAPEQAKGRAADKRSDVWAFGFVVYEMMTGHRAFDGEDVSDTLAAVLKDDPDWKLLPAGLPSTIRTLVKRCLAKDRKQRIADIAVAQFLLNEPALAAPPVSRRTKAFVAVSFAITVIAIVVAVWQGVREGLTPQWPMTKSDWR